MSTTTNPFHWLPIEAVLVTFGMVVAAHAESTAPVIVAAPPSELSTALNQALIAFLAVAVPTIGTFLTLALNRLRQKWGMEATAQNTANMESDLKAATNVGITKNLPAIKAKGWDDTAVQNAIIGVASAYLQQRFPDRTAQITQAAQKPDQAIPATTAVAETIAARLPDAIAVAAASPATPPVSPTQGQPK